MRVYVHPQTNPRLQYTFCFERSPTRLIKLGRYRLELMRQIYNTSDTSPELMSFVHELSSGEHSPEYPGIQYQAYARAEHQTTEQPNREAAQLLTGLASNCDVSNCLTSPTTSVSSTASSPSGSCGTASPPSPPSVIYDGSIAGSLNSGTLGKAGTRLTLANLMPSRLAVTAPHVTHVISVGSLDVQCIVCPGSYADSKLSD